MTEITMRSNPVYKTLNRPLTIMGVERTLFATALFTGAGFHLEIGSLLWSAAGTAIAAPIVFSILRRLDAGFLHADTGGLH